MPDHVALTADRSASTHQEVSDSFAIRPQYTAFSAAIGVERAWRLLDGRWKLLILFNLFGGRVLRFSELQRLIPGISQKMLAQQLQALEADGIVQRTVYDEKPLRVEYGMTSWGEALCPALDSLLMWVEAADRR